MDLHKQISTGLGTAIIVIFAITATVFSFKIYDYQMAQWEREMPDYATCKPSRKNQSSKNTQLANPASVFCKEHGGQLEIRTGQDGGQTGFCIFGDGSECEEWAYFRGECLNDPIINWKTYRSDKLGIELKHPNSYAIRDDYPNSGYPAKEAFFVDQNREGGIRSPIDGLLFTMSDKMIESKIAELKKRDELTEVIEEKTLSINGITIKKIVLSAAIGYNDAHYFFSRDNKYFEVIGNGDNKVHEEIIKTIVFIK